MNGDLGTSLDNPYDPFYTSAALSIRIADPLRTILDEGETGRPFVTGR